VKGRGKNAGGGGGEGGKNHLANKAEPGDEYFPEKTEENMWAQRKTRKLELNQT